MTHTNGPVPLGSPDYASRVFEEETLAHLLNREWVLLLGPRQHGKTSTLVRIRQQLIDAGVRCAFVDLQGVPPALDFRGLLEWFATKVSMSLGSDLQHPKGRGDSLEDWLACAVPVPGPPTVILVDEASSIRDEGVRNAFYGQIRSLKSAAAAAPGSLSSILQFVFAGTFRPETMVDERNSPFNVCRRVDTEDLTFEKVQMLGRAAVPNADIEEISKAIFDGVGGKPHLIQTLLSLAASAEAGHEVQAVTAELERLTTAGNDHLDSIFRTIVQDPVLTRIASAAAANTRVENDPANVDYKFIVVVGLMRREGAHLVFRNMLYEKIAKGSPQLRPEASQQPGVSSHFYLLDEGTLAFIVDAELKEICCAAYNGAVTAINARSYRFALIGFGVVLEAILLDWIVRQPAAVLTAAVQAARSGPDGLRFQRLEVATDPLTWRLVNLMRVARQLNGVRGPLELPEPLRQLRNFVHPVVMKLNYLREPDLKHEAIAAGGLVGAVMPDIQTS